MIVQPIVEGQGEEEAVPLLLRRLAQEAQGWQVTIARPHRRKRAQLVQRDSLQKAVRVAMLTSGCAAIVIIFDADDDCPRDIARELESWAREVSGEIPVAVIMANREYEAWFLGGIATLRGTHGFPENAEQHPNPEAPRDAKGELESRMIPGYTYSPSVDQAPFTALFDLKSAYRSCRSFRKLVTAFGVIMSSGGGSLSQWPPLEWTP